MQPYLELLSRVANTGTPKPTRARVGGTHIEAYTIFGAQMRFDLRAGFPAVTTKKLAFTSVAHELIWILSGSSNIDYLKRHGVTIWDSWADSTGELGPVYGVQWRRWPTPGGNTIDQIDQLLKGIERVKRNPRSSMGRRLIVSAWNPADIRTMALPPCHTLFQMSVTSGRLSCHLYQRSADMFLGVPFNIASYALLTHLIAHVTQLEVGDFIHSIGDAHIYTNHLAQVRIQLSREPYPLPKLVLSPTIESLSGLDIDQIQLVDYRHHPQLKGEVAV